jgi:hypothetical protein
MEFFINHTHKQIVFAGENAHLNKFLDKLLELVETKKWSLKDDIQMYIHGVDSDEEVCECIEEKGYYLDEEYWYIFFPDDDAEQQMIGEAYDRELARDEKMYGEDDRAWSGWDTAGASSDV